MPDHSITLKELSFIMIEAMFPDVIPGFSFERWSAMFDANAKPNPMDVSFVFIGAPWATDAVRAAQLLIARVPALQESMKGDRPCPPTI